MKQALPAITEPVRIGQPDGTISMDMILNQFIKITTVTHGVDVGYLRSATHVAGDLWRLVLERKPGHFVGRTFYVSKQDVAAYRCERCVRQAYLREGGPGHWPLTTCRMGRTAPHCTCAGCW